MIRVRFANSADADVISALSAEVQGEHAQALPALFKPVSHVTFAPSDVRALLQDPDRVLLVACVTEPVVGYASAQVHHRSETMIRYARTTLVIQWMGVEAAARRQGVGRALITAMRAEARERQIPSLELDVWAFNSGARAFYESMGFHEYRSILSVEEV